MADENTTPTIEDLQASVTRLERALSAERDAHKSTKAGFLAPVRTALGLGDDANLDEITTTLGTRLGDADKIVSERTAALTAERDEAVAKAAKIEQDWSAQQVTAALDSAFTASGAKPEHKADFLLLAKGLFGLKDGRVVTTGEGGEVAGLAPDQWCVARYRSLRPGHFPLSKGGGATGFTGLTNTGGPDVSCFKGVGNLTDQMRLVGIHGESAVRAALTRSGLTVPRWLK